MGLRNVGSIESLFLLSANNGSDFNKNLSAEGKKVLLHLNSTELLALCRKIGVI